MSIPSPLGAALCWLPMASCVRVLPCTEGSLSWLSLSVWLQEAGLAERLQCPQSLALFVAPSLKGSIMDTPMPVPFQVLCDTSPQLDRAGRDTTDLDGAMYIYSRRQASLCCLISSLSSLCA